MTRPPPRPPRRRASAGPALARRSARAPAALLRARFPAPVMAVLRRLDAAGFRSWLVGGAVRDLLLRRHRDEAADFDIATPARPEQVTALFPRVVPTGVEHGTVTVVTRGGRPVEVTTFRGEGAYLDGRRPSSVTFLDDVDEDLARRDFTVNALAYDPVGAAFRDPFGGRRDLRRRVLRAVGDPGARFAEDGLRPLRAARFAAQLGFQLDPATAAAIRPALPVAAQVAVERVQDELGKLLVAAHPGRGLALLEASGLLVVVLPALAALPPAERAHAFATAVRTPRDLTVRLAALLHVLAEEEPSVAAARHLRGVLERLRFPGHVCEGAAALVLEHGCVLAPGRPPPPEAPADVRRWLARVGRVRAPALLDLWEADAEAARPPARSRRERAALTAFRRRLARARRGGPPLTVGELALDGRAVMALLGVGGGPIIGEALRHLLGRVLDDPLLNTPASLASELRSWWSAQAPVE